MNNKGKKFFLILILIFSLIFFFWGKVVENYVDAGDRVRDDADNVFSGPEGNIKVHLLAIKHDKVNPSHVRLNTI